jgi:ABC-type Na+ efflux pump permease subunit
LDNRAVLARRELRVLAAEKTIVLALVIQLFIAAFSSFLVVGLVALYDPGASGGTQTVVAVAGDESAREDLLAAAREQPALSVRPYPTATDARAAFQQPGSSLDAVLVARERSGRVSVSALAPDDELETTLTVVQVREVLAAFERDQRRERASFLASTPLSLPPEGQSSPYYGFTYTVLVPLLVFLPVFISGSVAVDSLTEEVERGTLELLRVAPLSLVDIVDGKLLAAAGLAPVQAALWLALLEVNGTTIAHPAAIVVMVAALSLVVTAVGTAVAVLAPDRRAAQFLYSLGILGVFGAATLLPADPANAVARLAVDSTTPATFLTVGGYAVAAVAGYVGLRGVVGRVSVDGL